MHTYFDKKVLYAVNKFNKSVISRMALTKMKLFMKKKAIIVQVFIYSVVHYPFRYFRETRNYGNWPIVC